MSDCPVCDNGAGSGAPTTVGDALAHTLVHAMLEKEQQLDEELNRLDRLDDDEIEELRRKRLEEMRDANDQLSKMKGFGHGAYSELFSEREFFDCAKQSNHVVVHFFRPSTWRCKVIDKHMEALAGKHVGTRFVKFNIEKSQYLAEKLRVVMLPHVMLINKGKTDHSIIGFDEFGGKDDFETEDFERVLEAHAAIHKRH